MAKQELPNATESEHQILAGVLVEGRDAMKRVAHIVTHKDFFDQPNLIVFRAMEYLYKHGKEIDTLTVSDFLKLKGYLDMVGGPAALVDMSSGLTTIFHLPQHARTVADRAVLRRIIEASQKIIDRAYSEDDLDKFLIDAEDELKGVTRSSARAESKLAVVDLEEWRTIARETETPPGTVRGLSSGYAGLDDLTEGFEAGEMYILTGHTKHGKSQLATNWAVNVAMKGKTVLFINTEMTKVQMARRVNDILGETPLTGAIIINDRADLEHRDVIAIMENAKEKGCDMVIVDHLHYFARSVDNATGEVSKMTKDFKDAAVQYELPLLMLCHIDQSKPETMIPTIKMLKNSSSIAQDADLVMTVFRNEEKLGPVLQVHRLVGRSTKGRKKYCELFFEGLRLTETAPLVPSTDTTYYDNNARMLGERDEADLSLPDWTNNQPSGPVIPID